MKDEDRPVRPSYSDQQIEVGLDRESRRGLYGCLAFVLVAAIVAVFIWMNLAREDAREELRDLDVEAAGDRRSPGEFEPAGRILALTDLYSREIEPLSDAAVVNQPVVEEIELSDGTRCAVVVTLASTRRPGGIDCDWSSSSGPIPEPCTVGDVWVCTDTNVWGSRFDAPLCDFESQLWVCDGPGSYPIPVDESVELRPSEEVSDE